VSNGELTTKPTIETVLERISELSVSQRQRFDALEKRYEVQEQRLESLEKRYEMQEKRLDALEAHAATSDQRLKEIESQLKHVPITLDRIEGLGNSTRSIALEMRADFVEFRNNLRERMPELR
jgi:chromosome segregation ATPase